MPLTCRRLRSAGWLAYTSAVLTLPVFSVSLLLGLQDEYGARVAQAVISLLGTLLFVYVILTLLDVLNGCHGFHGVDLPIKLLIWLNVSMTVLSMSGLLAQSLAKAGAVLSPPLIVVSGIVQAFFGFRLLHMPAMLGGKHKPFCYLNIVTGISLASLVGIPIGLLASAVADVILGKIFFEMVAKEVQRGQN